MKVVTCCRGGKREMRASGERGRREKGGRNRREMEEKLTTASHRSTAPRLKYHLSLSLSFFALLAGVC